VTVAAEGYSDRPDLSPDDEPLDLSPLEPERWQSFLDATLQRVDVALAERGNGEADPLELIASWRRPLLGAALAAAFALAIAEVVLERREVRLERIERLVTISAGWPATGQRPTSADFLRALQPVPAAEGSRQ
jgi:hypothetical protein